MEASGQLHAPGAHWTGGWVWPGAGLGMTEISYRWRTWTAFPLLSCVWPVTIPTELSRLRWLFQFNNSNSNHSYNGTESETCIPITQMSFLPCDWVRQRYRTESVPSASTARDGCCAQGHVKRDTVQYSFSSRPVHRFIRVILLQTFVCSPFCSASFHGSY
jgi:hypothetical protein